MGLAGGLNLYGFAGGDPVNFGDPFGLCPDGTGADGRQTTDVSDCPENNIGNAWRALDGSGDAGRAVIGGVVSTGLRVESRAFTVDDNCGAHACYLSGVITLNQADDPGVLAVGISHEYAHSTETAARTKWAVADNELRAWDQSRPVYKGLQAPYAAQASAVFGPAFQTLATPAGRAANRRVFACRAERRAAGQPITGCVP